MKSPKDLLKDIVGIRHMERGKLCRMKRGPKNVFYNHQTWLKGRNVVRYVPRDEVPALKEAIAGYARFLSLTQAYADLVIRQSRKNRSTPLKPGN